MVVAVGDNAVGAVSVINSTFVGNVYAGCSLGGGALAVIGTGTNSSLTLNISATTMQNNTGYVAGGAVAVLASASASSGSLLGHARGTVTLTDSVFRDNVAGFPVGNACGPHNIQHARGRSGGGAAFVQLLETFTEVTVQRCTFVGNSVTALSADIGTFLPGAAIALVIPDQHIVAPAVTIDQCSIVNNSAVVAVAGADDDGFGVNEFASSGGGVFVGCVSQQHPGTGVVSPPCGMSGGWITVTGCNVTGNVASVCEGQGGGIAIVTVPGTQPRVSLQAPVQCAWGQPTVVFEHVRGVRVCAHLFVLGGWDCRCLSPPALRRCSPYVQSTASLPDRTAWQTAITIDDCDLSNNVAGVGAGIFVGLPLPTVDSCQQIGNVSVTVASSAVRNNSAVLPSAFPDRCPTIASLMSGTPTLHYGGAGVAMMFLNVNVSTRLYVENGTSFLLAPSSALVLVDSRVTGNTASAILCPNCNGGGLLVTDVATRVVNCTVSENYADGFGGAIFAPQV